MLSEMDVVLQRVAGTLDRQKIRYLVGGSVASSLHGTPRMTRDIDFVAEITEQHVAPLTADWEAEFYASDAMIRSAIQTHSSFNLIHLATMLKVDIFVPEPTPWKLEEMSRRQVRALGASTFYVASAEDMILQKLLWYRLTGERSERQWEDVQGILRVQKGRLDLAYLNQWADDLQITDLLTRAVDDAS